MKYSTVPIYGMKKFPTLLISMSERFDLEKKYRKRILILNKTRKEKYGEKTWQTTKLSVLPELSSPLVRKGVAYGAQIHIALL
jgi:hypothetical protein